VKLFAGRSKVLFGEPGKPTMFDKRTAEVIEFPVWLALLYLRKDCFLETSDAFMGLSVGIWRWRVKQGKLAIAPRYFLLGTMCRVILCVFRFGYKQDVAHELHTKTIARSKDEVILRKPVS